MADDFPDTSSKQGAISRKSLFERQKAEAEAKKARDRAETAAVYEDFVKSFDDEGNDIFKQTPVKTVTYGGSNHGSIPGKRHFTTSGLKSGPGSLGPSRSGPGGSRSSRGYNDSSGRRADGDYRTLAYEDEARDRKVDTRQLQDEDEEKAAAKPTLHLSSLPPGTSPAVVRALFTPSPLSVEDVRILPPPTPLSGTNAERRSISAIVTLAAETPSTDIETVVSHLKNRYLGFGYRLTLSRHLSSATLGVGSTGYVPSSKLTNLPFGAQPIVQHISLSRAPPPGHNRVPPPTSYISSTPYASRENLPPTQVEVQPPSDLKQLKLIHKTLEALLTHGPEFEALLMTRPEIQRDEQWSWLWDSRSLGGIYYRWRLWDLLTNGRERRALNPARSSFGKEVLFEGQSVWHSESANLKFEFVTDMDDFISDEDYDSSDEEADFDSGLARRYNDHNTARTAIDTEDPTEGSGYLNPLAKAKLVHLLSRLPDSNAKLRRGDVARVTGFAIEHAGAGAREVAQLITHNVVNPFNSIRHDAQADDGDSDQERDGDRTNDNDNSAASMVGLFIISDIMASSANAGVRHAWRYRSLFENALRQQKTFDKLGRLDRDLSWGKLKAEKWKRSVQNVLSLWEGWSVFPQQSQTEFLDHFLNPPLGEQEKRLAEAERERSEAELQRSKGNSKWRSVAADDQPVADDVEMNDVDGVAMDDDDEGSDDIAEEDLIDEELDGVPMMDSSEEDGGAPHDDIADSPHGSAPGDGHDMKAEEGIAKLKTTGNKQRMRAVDMFADDSS